WLQSFVVDDKTFCIYLAENEAAVQAHARLSGIPATKVSEVRGVIDPTTAS
ncbi:MAG: nickel-binding protein, partial [Pseudomonadota bacterium]